MTNSLTTPEVMQKWIEFGRSFQLKFDVWNVSDYKTASYFKKTHTGKSIAEISKDKLVVILSDRFKNVQPGEATSNTMALVEKGDILEAATRLNVSTLVIGEEWNLKREIEPLNHRERLVSHQSVGLFIEEVKRNGIWFEEDHQITLEISYWCCKPARATLDLLAEDARDQIIEKFPHLQFLFIKLRSFLYYTDTAKNRIRLGYLIVRKRLGVEEARVAYFEPDHQFYGVKLNVLRCIPVERRLKLVHVDEDEAKDVLEESFIADYIDEFSQTQVSNSVKSLTVLEKLEKSSERIRNDGI